MTLPIRKLSKLEIVRDSLCMHITALKSFGDFLLIGEGNQVSLINVLQQEIIETEIIFSNSSIHGIKSVDESKFIFFGSKSLRIYSCKPESTKCFKSFSDEIILCDWIHDAEWITSSDENSNTVAVISAHNCVTFVNITNPKELKTIHCAENCILYSANIILSTENVLIVAVGTVFKQILLWSPNSSSETNGSKLPLHCLEGHQGVIFSISYSKYHNLFSSTSDDRSIRLWKVYSNMENDLSLEFWENASIYPTYVLFAHESRVWNSIILENCIVSIGEDSHICFWDMKGQILKQKKCHKGGSIWCLETNYSLAKLVKPDSINNYIAYTGGSDGGVYCWNIQEILNSGYIKQISLHDGSSEKDFPRVVSIVYSNKHRKVMVTTDRGWLSLYDINVQLWKDIFYDFSFASYCISSVSNENIIALGNMKGELVLLEYKESLSCRTEVQKFKIHQNQIFSLHWVDRNSEYLLSCGTMGNMTLWKITLQTGEFFINNLKELLLPQSKPHWWSTCAIFINKLNYLIVGDRGGNINIYSLNSTAGILRQIDPSYVYKHIHGENGVTDIQENKSLIYSTGRDGRVLLYSISDESLHLLHAIKISHDLEWIAKLLFYGSDLLLLGFHTHYFVVWSTNLESTVMSVDCGGGHRSWDFNLSEDGQATFTAIKKKAIVIAKEDMFCTLNNSLLKAGVTGRTFCQICYLFTTDYELLSVLAAGGEDNALHIIGFTDDQSNPSKIVSLHSLAGHLSSIRSLAKTPMLEKNTFLLASVGGRAQIILWEIKNNLDITCRQLASYVLFSPERNTKKPWKENQNIQVDPQTRLMDATLHMNEHYESAKEIYIIALACSDSFFRIYQFDATEKILNLIYTIQPEKHCILRLSYIQNISNLDKDIFFLIASTNGNLNFISHRDLMSAVIEKNSLEIQQKIEKPHFQTKLHKSGINALDVKHVFENVWLICTAGDDNAISAMVLEVCPNLNDDSYFKFISKTNIPHAHASQITGLKFIGTEIIISASIDQRINLWKWTFENNNINITLKTSKVSFIPDIAHLECWEDENNCWTAVICGEGIEKLYMKNII